MAPRHKFKFETDYINEAFRCGIATLTIRAKASASLGALGADVTDVNYVFRTGRVVVSDMIDRRGLWHVRGKTVDDLELELIVAVESSEVDIDLLAVLEVRLVE